MWSEGMSSRFAFTDMTITYVDAKRIEFFAVPQNKDMLYKNCSDGMCPRKSAPGTGYVLFTS